MVKWTLSLKTCFWEIVASCLTTILSKYNVPLLQLQYFRMDGLERRLLLSVLFTLLSYNKNLFTSKYEVWLNRITSSGIWKDLAIQLVILKLLIKSLSSLLLYLLMLLGETLMVSLEFLLDYQVVSLRKKKSVFHTFPWLSHKSNCSVGRVLAADVLAASEAVAEAKFILCTYLGVLCVDVGVQLLLVSRDLSNSLSLSTQKHAVNRLIRGHLASIWFEYQTGRVNKVL